jgi:hypothetical protein
MKNRTNPRSMPAQVIIGILVIGMGLLFLLDNLGIWNFHRAISFWPVVFILVGVLKLIDSRNANGHLLGAVMIGIGVAMTLNRLGYIDVSWRAMWPVLMIVLGGTLLVRALTGRRLAGPALKDQDAGDSVLDITAILGGFERRISSQTLRGGEVTAIMGGCVLDMRGASIEGEAVLNVFALFGGITIKCPPDWDVVLQGTPIMGGFEEKTIAAPGSTKRLVVRGYVIMGGLEVRN